MAGGPHDNYNLIQFRLDADQVARVDEHLSIEVQTSGRLTSRNTFCKQLLSKALAELLPSSGVSIPTMAPAE